jgi:hypothetical protein
LRIESAGDDFESAVGKPVSGRGHVHAFLQNELG